jgi:hypothetical protein
MTLLGAVRLAIIDFSSVVISGSLRNCAQQVKCLGASETQGTGRREG